MSAAPHAGECECWQCAEWRLYQANLKGWDVLLDAIFNEGDTTDAHTAAEPARPEAARKLGVVDGGKSA